MLVTRANFEEWFARLLAEAAAEKEVGFDTETTALFWWKSPHYADEPRVFSMQFSTAATDYYFDFGAKESVDPLGPEHFERFRVLFTMPDLVWDIQNGKFDMHHCANHGLQIAGTVWCTQAIARVVNNLEEDCSLDGLSEKYLGEGKVDLKEYWDERRVTKVKKPGENGKFYDFLHFDRLPLDVLVRYGERDTRLVYRLAKWQRAKIEELNQRYFSEPGSFGGSLWKVIENELALTKTLFAMERRGVQLDLSFVGAAHAAACAGIKSTLAELDPLATEYVAKFNATCEKLGEQLKVMDWESPIHLQGLFDFLAIPYGKTDKDAASFDKNVLEKSKHPVAKKILEYRRHAKRAHTYLENFLWLADTSGVLHCNFAQGGPRTGRMSCREPNLQNVPKRADKKEADFVLRKCFVPRPGYVLVSKDYDQVEYRLMVDYARERALVDRILNEGLDVHDATMQALSLPSRDDAKTMNFMLLYGGGVAKLCLALFADTPATLEECRAVWMLWKWPTWRRPDFGADKLLRQGVADRGDLPAVLENIQKAQAKLDDYFSVLPAVEDFIDKVKDKAKKQGVIHTWLGRILQYGIDPKYGGHTNYKAPNGLIQGGAGDVSKVATNRVGARLAGTKSFLILHVHDELVSEIHESELALVPELTKIMEQCYPHRLIPLTAGAAWSKKSWGDLTDGVP